MLLPGGKDLQDGLHGLLLLALHHLAATYMHTMLARGKEPKLGELPFSDVPIDA